MIKIWNNKIYAGILICAITYGATTTSAQTFSYCDKDSARCTYEANKRRLGLISGGVKGTYIKIADDIRSVLNGFKGPQFADNEGLRITPMVGAGSPQNIEDLLYLTGTDIGLVQADVLEQYRQGNSSFGRYQNIINNIKYLAQIYSEEVHVVCRRGACGKDFGSNTNIVVNLGPRGSGTEITASIITNNLGFKSDKFRYKEYEEALGELRKPKSSQDQLDAMFYVGGKPIALFKNVEEKDGLELVEVVDLPESLDVYEPGVLDENDGYPGLMGSQAKIRTVAVPAILVVWGGNYQQLTRNQNLRAFCLGLVQKKDEFRKRAESGAAHPKWKNWDPTKSLGNHWVRHEFMEDALRSAR
jgi:TRAP transporter TAXI family solute receptor